ncbi:hypothetical protein CCUS01_09267 [Colletotrichum cuscutae]|uniref:Uncharacterized protein n=1 Tax=Colletotrichum cuscutae TaxID=1209917 RepID=A0AAI9UK73_9PEZI|nr:hypothetical protein CCUS01_09267 [Colletotrichum cuscutae]
MPRSNWTSNLTISPVDHGLWIVQGPRGVTEPRDVSCIENIPMYAQLVNPPKPPLPVAMNQRSCRRNSISNGCFVAKSTILGDKVKHLLTKKRFAVKKERYLLDLMPLAVAVVKTPDRDLVNLTSFLAAATSELILSRGRLLNLILLYLKVYIVTFQYQVFFFFLRFLLKKMKGRKKERIESLGFSFSSELRAVNAHADVLFQQSYNAAILSMVISLGGFRKAPGIRNAAVRPRAVYVSKTEPTSHHVNFFSLIFHPEYCRDGQCAAPEFGDGSMDDNSVSLFHSRTGGTEQPPGPDISVVWVENDPDCITEFYNRLRCESALDVNIYIEDMGSRGLGGGDKVAVTGCNFLLLSDHNQN